MSTPALPTVLRPAPRPAPRRQLSERAPDTTEARTTSWTTLHMLHNSCEHAQRRRGQRHMSHDSSVSDVAASLGSHESAPASPRSARPRAPSQDLAAAISPPRYSMLSRRMSSFSQMERRTSEQLPAYSSALPYSRFSANTSELEGCSTFATTRSRVSWADSEALSEASFSNARRDSAQTASSQHSSMQTRSDDLHAQQAVVVRAVRVADSSGRRAPERDELLDIIDLYASLPTADAVASRI